MIGRRLLPQLVVPGHQVTTTTTTRAKSQLLEQLRPTVGTGTGRQFGKHAVFVSDAGVEENETMTDQTIRPFDIGALYSALDDKRTELGISWRRVADQLWELSAELNDRRRDHPISPATLTNMAKNPRISCQHALFMLRWLGRAPESFLTGATGDEAGFALPAAGTDRRLRWSLKLLYAAMDEKRRADGLTWPRLAAILGCSSNQLTGLRTARYATGMDTAMRIVQWIRRPAADFVYPATW